MGESPKPHRAVACGASFCDWISQIRPSTFQLSLTALKWSDACRGPLSLAPRLYVLPAELNPFKDLFRRLGVPEQFTAQQFLGVLADLAAAAGSEPLSARELDQAIACIQVGSCMSRCSC